MNEICRSTMHLISIQMHVICSFWFSISVAFDATWSDFEDGGNGTLRNFVGQKQIWDESVGHHFLVFISFVEPIK